MKQDALSLKQALALCSKMKRNWDRNFGSKRNLVAAFKIRIVQQLSFVLKTKTWPLWSNFVFDHGQNAREQNLLNCSYVREHERERVYSWVCVNSEWNAGQPECMPSSSWIMEICLNNIPTVQQPSPSPVCIFYSPTHASAFLAQEIQSNNNNSKGIFGGENLFWKLLKSKMYVYV